MLKCFWSLMHWVHSWGNSTTWWNVLLPSGFLWVCHFGSDPLMCESVDYISTLSYLKMSSTLKLYLIYVVNMNEHFSCVWHTALPPTGIPVSALLIPGAGHREWLGWGSRMQMKKGRILTEQRSIEKHSGLGKRSGMSNLAFGDIWDVRQILRNAFRGLG